MKYKDLYDQAENRYLTENYKEALRYFKQAYETEPTNDCYNYIGCTYSKLGEFDLAVSCFEKLMILCPNWERPVYNLANVYIKLKNFGKAIDLLNLARRINPDSEDD